MRTFVLPALGLSLLGLLSACAPSVSRPPQTQVQASAALEGHMLTVTLLNAGPNPLLLENSCPRPFAIDFLDYPDKDKGGLKPQQYNTCWDVNIPPQVWQVGERLTTGVTVDYPAGTHTFKTLATVCVKIIEKGQPKGDFGSVAVNVPQTTFTVK